MIIGLTGIFTAIAVIIFLTRRGWNLAAAMLSGTLIIAVFGRYHPALALDLFLGALTDPTTVFLTLIMITITSFGSLLRETNSLDVMIKNLGKVVRDLRFLSMLIPALIGLLMVPGGAVFSAPMAENVGRRLKMDVNAIAAANVVFRHLFFLIFPFYSGLLMMSELSEVKVDYFIRFNLIILVLTIVFTFYYFFGRISMPAPEREKEKFTFKMFFDLGLSLLPFILVLILGLGFKLYFPLAFLAGCLYVVALGNPLAKTGESIKQRLLMAWKGISWPMTLSIIGVMAFKDFVQALGALDELSAYLHGLGVPLIILVVSFPLLISLVTGNIHASLGLSLPFFLTLLPTAESLPYLGVMYVCALVGYVSSPIHLCLILTSQYLKASLPRVLKQVGIVSGFMVILSLLIFILA